MTENASVTVDFEPVDEPDADTDPDLDPEAHMLCAALWSRDSVTLRFLFTHMREDDFENPFYRPIFAALREAVAADLPHVPTSVAASFAQAGRAKVPDPVHNALACRAHTRKPSRVGRSPCSKRGRRSYLQLAATMQLAAEEASEDELFTQLVELLPRPDPGELHSGRLVFRRRLRRWQRRESRRRGVVLH